ncbi:hypothetical protein L596_028529 [Steinernema carpocapsae]|uniref:Uncharacterized protein n=1 Tax=Steinernema carpocapsae TaxID=34508 RepID=A0A4U5LYR4_STECR|nr:hypothetical protein L596_028529 [Steinernema carpocapsae]
MRPMAKSEAKERMPDGPDDFDDDPKSEDRRTLGKRSHWTKSEIDHIARLPPLDFDEDPKSEDRQTCQKRSHWTKSEIEDIMRLPPIDFDDNPKSEDRRTRGKRSCWTKSEIADIARLPPLDIDDDPKSEDRITRGKRSHWTKSEIDDIARLPALHVDDDPKSEDRMTRGKRSHWTQSELDDIARLPPVDARDVDVEPTAPTEHSTTTAADIRNIPDVFARLEVDDCWTRCSSICSEAYSRVARIDRGRPSLTDVRLLPDMFDSRRSSSSSSLRSDLTVNKRMFGEQTIADVSNCPSICSEAYGRVECIDRGRPSLAELHLVPDLLYSSSSARTSLYFNPKKAAAAANRGLNRYPSFDDVHKCRRAPSEHSTATSADFRDIPDVFARPGVDSDVTINKRKFSDQSIRDISNCPSICSEAYGRVGCIDRDRPSFADLRLLPDQFEGRCFDFSSGPHSDHTINKRMYSTQSIEDINNCPSICSEAYGRVGRIDRRRPSFADLRLLPNPFDSRCSDDYTSLYFNPRKAAAAADRGLNRYPSFDDGRKHRHRCAPSEDSTATSADIRKIPDVFARPEVDCEVPSEARRPFNRKSFPAQSVSSNPCVIWRSSTRIAPPDFGAPEEYKSDDDPKEILEIARLPPIASNEKTTLQGRRSRDESPSKYAEIAGRALEEIRSAIAVTKDCVSKKIENVSTKSKREAKKKRESSRRQSKKSQGSKAEKKTQKSAKEKPLKKKAINVEQQKKRKDSVYIKAYNEPKNAVTSEYAFLK